MEETTHALFSIGPLEVTGTVTTMWAIIAVLTLLSWLATRNMKDVPGKLQNIAEMAVGSLQNYFNGTLGTKLCKKYFPVFATFFIFIIVSNYSGLLPGAGHLKAFHVPTASLSVTAGLAIVAFFTTHFVGVKERGFGKYLIGVRGPYFDDDPAVFPGDHRAVCPPVLAGAPSLRKPLWRGSGDRESL